MNEPDSVYLFSYSCADGHSGLRFAWSPDGEKWLPVAEGYDYVKCDFGPWGSEKKMFRPQLLQTRDDGKWHSSGLHRLVELYGRMPLPQIL